MGFSIEVAQSTPICILLSAVGGAIEVLATALLAYKDAVEHETGRKWSKMASICALSLNVFLQVTSSIVGNLFAPWFGPVSLVGPIFLCAQLVANMVVFGYILGLESFNKDMRIGTYVVVVGVILLPIVGPAAQDDQDIAGLLGEWYSLAWSCFLTLGMVASFFTLLCINVQMLRERYRIVLLLMARATAFSVNLTVSKLMVLNVTTMVLAVSIGLKIASGLVITYACIVQASAVPQATFAPLNASALIIVNALTGMIIWEDWRVVGSWVGYACVFVQLILGNYLLLGDIVLLQPENQKYGRAKAIEMATGSIIGSTIYCGSQAAVDADMESLDEAPLPPVRRPSRKPPQNQGYEVSQEGDAYEYWDDEGVVTDEPVVPSTSPGLRPRRRNRRVSFKEAWSVVYGLGPNSEPPHRRNTIFGIDEDSNYFEDAAPGRRNTIFTIGEEQSDYSSEDAGVYRRGSF